MYHVYVDTRVSKNTYTFKFYYKLTQAIHGYVLILINANAFEING